MAELNNIDVATLNTLSPEIISRQATINFGTIGHVAHGKSTVVRSLSGVHTVRFKNEKERNITIKLGYANAKIYKCENPNCPPPQCYASYGSSKEDNPPCQVSGCNSRMKLMRHISFVDCPGHDILMATMLNGAAVMDAALLLIAGNEFCPQPQTSEHLAALEIMKLKHIIILQNKVELIKADQAKAQYEQIVEFVDGTIAKDAPIIPISAILKYNIDVVAEYICTQIPVPVHDFTSKPEMILIRSFDVNKPGDAAETIKGGVVGGSILRGVLKVGDEIEIRPGIVRRIPDQSTFVIRPIRSIITSLFAEQNVLQLAVPGGLIGVGTNIDPTLTRADRLVGHVLAHPDHAPEVFYEIRITYYLLRRLLGVRSKEGKKGKKVDVIKEYESLMINVGSTSVMGFVKYAKHPKAKILLRTPVCSQVGHKVALSRRIDKHFRLIGWGEIQKGLSNELTYSWKE